MKIEHLFLFLLLSSCAAINKIPQEINLGSGTTKFCFVGDMGLGNEAQAKVAEAMEKEKCHSIHMTGDLIYPSGIKSLEDPELESKFLKYYRPLAQSGNRPSLNLVLGNHDHRGNALAWEELAKRETFVNYPGPYYVQNWSGLCLIHLDTNSFKLLRDFIRAEKQANWLSGQLNYLKNNCSQRVAITHHPYISRGPKHGNASGYLKSFFENHILGKFDYIISGHEHVLSDEGKARGTHQLISGAGGNYTTEEEVGFLVLEAKVGKDGLNSINYYFRRVLLTPLRPG